MGNHDILACPYCKGSFTNIQYGRASVLKCSCFEYPVIEGIPILIKRPDTLYAAKLIRKKKLNDALAFQLQVSFSFFHRAINRTKKTHIPLLENCKNRLILLLKRKKAKHLMKMIRNRKFLKLISSINAKGWGSYIKYRFLSESYLVGEQIILNNPKGYKSKGTVIDHLCGAGHYTFLLGKVFKGRIFATDHSFLNLMTAKHFLNPKAKYICIDGSKPMPFKDESISLFFNSDSFHYLRGKREQMLCLNEARRILDEKGEILFVHLHIKGGNNVGEGNAYSVKGYKNMFSKFSPAILDESDVLKKLYNVNMDGKSIAIIGNKKGKNTLVKGIRSIKKRIEINNPLKEKIRKRIGKGIIFYNDRKKI